LKKFNAGLRHHINNNRRAHLLYGTTENHASIILELLQKSYFEIYHPLKKKLKD
jgi:hypothetical protein